MNVTGTAVTPEYDDSVADLRPGTMGHGLALKAGWNQVGNPYDYAVSLADIKVYDGTNAAVGLLDASNQVTQQAFWIFTNGAYGLLTGSLAAGRGGWVKKLTSGDGVIFFPASSTDSAAADVVRAEPADLDRPPDPPSGLAAGSGGSGGGGCFVDFIRP